MVRNFVESISKNDKVRDYAMTVSVEASSQTLDKEDDDCSSWWEEGL